MIILVYIPNFIILGLLQSYKKTNGSNNDKESIGD